MLLPILTILLLAIIFFTVFKGVIRMMLLAIAVIGGIAVWLLIQRHGFTFLAFITHEPSPWMVQTLAWAAAIFTFLVFYQGMQWFSQLFSWRKFSLPGLITSILMSLMMLWVFSVGLSYYAEISRMGYFHEKALAILKQGDEPAQPWAWRTKQVLRQSELTSWLEKVDPMEDRAQANLASLVAFGCTLDEKSYMRLYKEQLLRLRIPQSSRLLELFKDSGLRKLVAEQHFVTLLENERLKTFLQYGNTYEIFRQLEFSQ